MSTAPRRVALVGVLVLPFVAAAIVMLLSFTLSGVGYRTDGYTANTECSAPLDWLVGDPEPDRGETLPVGTTLTYHEGAACSDAASDRQLVAGGLVIAGAVLVATASVLIVRSPRRTGSETARGDA